MKIENLEIDQEKINQKAKEAAEKAILQEVEEYYNGYNSPFRKKIREELSEQKSNFLLQIPDLSVIISQKINNEIDKIAANFVGSTVLNDLTEILVRAKKELKLSEILKVFVEYAINENGDLDSDDFECNIEDAKDKYFFGIILKAGDIEFKIRCHKKEITEEINGKKFTVMNVKMKDSRGSTLFNFGHSSKEELKINHADGHTISVPFDRYIADDNFGKYIYKLMLCNSIIEFDTNDFNEDMFPENECYC